jgi:hypothetical protein
VDILGVAVWINLLTMWILRFFHVDKSVDRRGEQGGSRGREGRADSARVPHLERAEVEPGGEEDE